MNKKIIIIVSIIFIISTLTVIAGDNVEISDINIQGTSVDTWYNATSIDNESHVYTFTGGLDGVQGLTSNSTHFFSFHSDEIEYRLHDGTYKGTYSNSGAIMSGTGCSKMAGAFYKDGFIYIACTNSDHGGDRPGYVVKVYPNNFTQADYWEVDNNNLNRGINAVAFLNGYWYVGESSYSASGDFDIDVFDMDWSFVKKASTVSYTVAHQGWNGFSVYEDHIYGGVHDESYLVLKQNSDLTLDVIYSIDTKQASSQDSTFVGDTFYFTNRSSPGVDTADFIRTPYNNISFNDNFYFKGKVNDTTDVRINYSVDRDRGGITTLLDSYTTDFDGSDYWETSQIGSSNIALNDKLILYSQAVKDDLSENFSDVKTSNGFFVGNNKPFILNSEIYLLNESGDIKLYFKPMDLDNNILNGTWWITRERNNIIETMNWGTLTNLDEGDYTTQGILESANYTTTDIIRGYVALRDDDLFGTTYEAQYYYSDEIRFLYINGLGNDSAIQDSTPTINWTVMEDASQYHLEIDDDADFSSPEVNYTDINQWNYPAKCNINSTRVSFTLPTPLPGYGEYYMRVRAFVKD